MRLNGRGKVCYDKNTSGVKANKGMGRVMRYKHLR